MVQLIRPYGGVALKPLLLEGDSLMAERAHAADLPQLARSSREAGDVVMLGIGGFTTFDDFTSEVDWRGVCDDMQTAIGLFWPIPITLSTSADVANTLSNGYEVALTYEGEALALCALTSAPASTRSTNAELSSRPRIPTVLEGRW